MPAYLRLFAAQTRGQAQYRSSFWIEVVGSVVVGAMGIRPQKVATGPAVGLAVGQLLLESGEDGVGDLLGLARADEPSLQANTLQELAPVQLERTIERAGQQERPDACDFHYSYIRIPE